MDKVFKSKKDAPVLKIDTESELACIAEEWMDVLNMNDWIISFELVDFNGSEMEGKYVGLCDVSTTNKCGFIYLCRWDQIPKDSALTICMEKTLVHELLHCLYPVYGDTDYSAEYMYETEHAKLEMMSRALIRAKYNITADYFMNNRLIGGDRHD